MLMTRTLVAIGFGSAMAIATPAPTLAQGVYIGPGGVGVDTGRPDGVSGITEIAATLTSEEGSVGVGPSRSSATMGASVG